MGLRRKGREIVLQTLYSLDFDHESALTEREVDREMFEPILNNIFETNSIKPTSRIYPFCNELIVSVIENLQTIDNLIKTHLEHWNIDKLGVLDRNLLRLAIADILYQNTPPPIAIDEAVEIAKKFCCDKSSKLINGVLDHIAKDLPQQPHKTE
ncbi:MAG: transcription antitermination factor NusB [Candidatus Cloacimonetes bacterium]|nr:transcription antitermination factor NusB [Candidatus Cloacimonadota bacterium]